jgi:tetratricopeptide (TPR) repeat protein
MVKPIEFVTGLKGNWTLGLLLVLAVLGAYAPVRNAGYIWDDDVILTANLDIVGPLGLKEIWTTAASDRDFAPLTRTTFWLEHAIWGLNPGPYHIVNVLLQGVCAIFLWRVLLQLRVPGAWFGAAVWALHPVQVESVAWVAEMKNTESGVFFLLSGLFFLKWLRGSDAGEGGSGRDRVCMLVFGLLAMLCKASTVVLPVVLGLGAWWVERRLSGRVLKAVLPLCFISLVVTLVSIWGQHAQMVDAVSFQQPRSWPERVVTAGEAVWFYLGKLVWPSPLAAIYPQWQIDPGTVVSYLPAVAVVLAFILLWIFRRAGTGPYFFAFAFFIVALLPVLGLAENTIFRYSFVFDHFQYLASMGPLALVGAAGGLVWKRTVAANRWMPVAAGMVILVALGARTFQRTLVYLTPESYWTDAIAKNPNSWLVHYNLGDALEATGHADRALVEYRAARDLKPASPAPYERIGSKLDNAGAWDEAAASYREALAISPHFHEAQAGLGNALYHLGQVDEAIAAYREALATKEDDDSVHSNLGAALFSKGQIDEAIGEYQRALALNPNVAFTHDNLALALLQKKQVLEAIAEYQRALELDPQFPDGHYDLGKAFLIAGQFEKAIVQFQAALSTDPSSAKAHNNLGIAYAMSGRPDEAALEFERVLQLKPGDADAEKNLALAKAAAAKAKSAPAH